MSINRTFGVVIPTRDRPKTLEACLSTVLGAADAGTEILVHDNSTDDRTKSLVERFADRRIRYLRVNDLAMTDNWEAAVNASRADFITVLGDDDGLMPFALKVARTAVERTGADVISWNKARYSWPDREQDANKLKLPAALPAHWVRGRSQLEMVLRDPRQHYGNLPMLYNAFVARTALERIRQTNGRLLGSRAPDVYSGAAIAATTERFLKVGIPLSVNGLSGASNGVNVLTRPSGTAVAADFAGLNRKAGIAIHPAVPDVRSLAGAVFDSCLVAIDALSVPIPVDRFHVVRTTLKDSVVFGEGEIDSARSSARQAVRGHRSLERRVQRMLVTWQPVLVDVKAEQRAVRVFLKADAVQVDASRFGVHDIAGAVDFIAAHYDVLERWVIPTDRMQNLAERLRTAVGLSRDAFLFALRPGR